jgi:hypothetical protein
MRLTTASVVLAGVVFWLFTGPVAPALADAPNMKDGLWEITIKMEMAGMPMEMPEMTHTQCITKDNAVPDTSPPDQKCKMINNQIKGDTVTWEMECDTPQGPAHTKGTVTYSGDTFAGTVDMNMGQMVMTQKMRGRRVGDCQ